MQQTILVTGGAGFIGSHLCERLVAQGHRVISLDNYFTGSKDNHMPGVEYREGHTKDIAKLVPETPDCIYHLGEYARVEQSVLEPDVVHDLNTAGTEGVIAFWRDRKSKLVYAGSSTKFGDEGRTRQTSPYASTKAANTEKVKTIGEAEGLSYAITYFYNVYGLRERAGIYGTVIEAFKQMWLMGAPLAVVSPGTQRRNFTHVEDIVDGLLLVGERGAGDEYGLGNTRAYSILEVARMFTADVVMLPPRSSNRMQSAIDTSKSAAIGWNAHRSLDAYVEAIRNASTPAPAREKRVLVFSTTFFPVEGPAERALYRLIEQVPDVRFDIVTSTFNRAGRSIPLPNVRTHDIGFGRPIDKYLLPIFGYFKARQLEKRHAYLFTWSLMASYGALAGVLLKWRARTPLLVTLADQDVARRGGLVGVGIKLIFAAADQVYGLGHSLVRRSLGVGDAFANQLRYTYADILNSLA